MAGRMGNARVTTQNLTVHRVDAERGLLLIKGAVPGPRGGLLFVKSAAKGGVDGMTSTVDGRAPRARVRHPRQHRADAPGRRGPAGRGAPGHALHEDPRRGPWRRQEAVPPEGHRPRPPGLHPCPAVRRRWRRARPHAARLHAAHPQEDEGRRAARCAVGPGPRRRRVRRRHARRRRRPVHEGGARRARRRGGRGQDARRPHRRRPRGPALAAQPAARAPARRPASSTPTTCSTASAWCSPRRRWRSSSTGRSARRRAPPRPASR